LIGLIYVAKVLKKFELQGLRGCIFLLFLSPVVDDITILLIRNG